MSGSTEGVGTVLHYPFDFSDYRDPDNQKVEADVAAADVTRVLQDLLGGEVVEWPGARGSGEALARLKEFARLTHTCSLVWVGHGASDDNEASVLIPGIAGSSEDDEFTPEAFALHLRNQQSRRHGRADEAWTMVVIEACGAGRFVQLVAAELLRRRSGQRIALVGVGSPDGPGHLGEAAKILGQVVRSTLTRNDTEVAVSDLLAEVERRLGDHDGATYALGVASCRIRRAGIPVTATLDVYARLEAVLQQLPERERSHFARKGMGADFGEFTWSFVGRRDERRRVVEHLSTGSGLLAVTGPAGSGKSAVLGNVLLRARPKVRELLVEAGLLDNDPVTERERDLTIDGVLHVTGMTHDEVAESLAGQLGADLSSANKRGAPPAGGELANRLVAAVEANRRQGRVVVDALDEARDPLSIAGLLRRVAEAGVSLVVGTRASTREGVDHATHDRELLEELGVASDLTLVVGRDPDALAAYVNLTCAREGISDHLRALLLKEVCAPTSDTAAGRERQFLFVRLLVHELVARQRLGKDPTEAAPELLEGTHRTVFAAAVARLREHAPTAASLLEALAYARGAGLPRLGGIWELVASVVHGASVAPLDIDEALSLLAPYVVLDAENGRSVYRLAHRTFVEYFEQEWGDNRETSELAVVRGLIESANDVLASATPTTDRNLDAYLVSHLAAHVGAAGAPGWQLLADHEPLLDVIDPRTVASEVMASGIVENIPTAIASVTMGAHLLASCSPSDRRGVRQLVGAGVTGQLVAEPSESATWWVRSAARSSGPVHRTLAGHTDRVNGIAIFTHQGRDLLATSAGQVVRIWAPDTGRQVGLPLVGHTSGVSEIASFTHRDRVLLAIGAGRVVQIWDPGTGEAVGRPLAGHAGRVSGIVSFPCQGRVLLAIGAGRVVQIWDPGTGEAVGSPLAGHAGLVSGIVSFTHQGRTLLATTSWDRTVRIWDPGTGRQVVQSLIGSTSGLRIVSFIHQGRARLATTNRDRTVRIWDPDSGAQVGQPLTGHTGRVSGIVSFT
ncbi:MAG: WD40 repeat domain-containing protein, partial [Micropruina sp.]|uniref:hypothetical protein n=1 Tax=Micropruina sp. TaxID=2737536 RepID=UPI0039E415BF